MAIIYINWGISKALMEAEPQIIHGQDGLKLHTHHWRHAKPAAICCIIPGFGEHGGRYAHVAAYLLRNSIAALALDCRGHGKSDGLRGHASSMEALVDDVEEFIKLARREYNDVPVFLFGHSMGGNIVLNYVLRKPVSELQGFIASSPWLKLAFEPPGWKLKLGKVMAGIIPRLRQPNGLDSSALSKDKSIVEAYDNDPLVNNLISARLFKVVTEGAEFIQLNAPQIELPGLVYHGTQDRLIEYQATKDLATRVDSVTWEAYEGVYHEPHNDLEHELVLDNLVKWITGRPKK